MKLFLWLNIKSVSSCFWRAKSVEMWGREHKATLKKRDSETVHSKHTHTPYQVQDSCIYERQKKRLESHFLNIYIDNWFNWYDWCMWWMARGGEKRECMNMRVVSAVAPLLPARPSGTSDGGKPTQQSGPGGRRAGCPHLLPESTWLDSRPHFGGGQLLQTVAGVRQVLLLRKDISSCESVRKRVAEQTKLLRNNERIFYSL